MRITALIFSLLLILHAIAWAAPPRPRPLAGIGLLSIPVSGSENRDGSGTILLYREPGVGRIVEMEVSDFPAMTAAIKASPRFRHIAVTKKKGEWLKVIFDDSGREGWLLASEGWEFKSWQHYLKGREVKPLNGLRKELYQLKASPSPSAASIATVNKDRKLRVVELEDSWILVLVDFASSGWLRWKDDDGRLVISAEWEN